MELPIYAALFLPLFGFLVLFASSFYIPRLLAGLIGCSTVLTSFVLFASLLYNNTTEITLTLFDWIAVPGINSHFTLLVDPLSLVMTLIITGVGFLIHLYSNGYMDHEEDFARFFACLNFFIFAMLLLVLAGDLLLLFVGWEGVGLASYLLIGFWYQRPTAAAAATKAFVVNRIGDLGLLLGIILTLYTFGTADIAEITKAASTISVPLLTVITLLYFVGATGKSAQMPLHTWLPDAMEGPTPVSALIHAATMVTAGVYLVVRMHDLFLLAPFSLLVVGTTGAITALYAALSAVGQTDLKRVLAYSTVSQLGLMFLACGVGATYAAMFHLVSHAFIKALLFLSAGNVVHMLHGTTEMDKMGGLRKVFTKTHWFFLIGVLALSGLPPTAAFFSKDLILEEVHELHFTILYYLGLFAAILTGFYLTRAYCLTFLGNEKKREAKEAPLIMLLPVFVLALLSLGGGFLGYSFGKRAWMEDFLAEAGVDLPIPAPSNIFYDFNTWISVTGAVLGIGGGAFLFTRYVLRFNRKVPLLKNAFYFDTLYATCVVAPMKAISRGVTQFFEPKIFDGSIQFVTQLTAKSARLLAKQQSGQIRSYVAWMVLGSVLLTLFFLRRGQP